MKPPLRIGTRGSLLALAQGAAIKHRLEIRYPKIAFRLVTIKTMGDEFQTVALFKKTNIGVFTKALETKLLKKEIDIAVHSLKDLPTILPRGLVLAAFPKRLDPGDVLISKKRFSLATLPKGASVGTGSPRRKRQLNLLRPDLKIREIRGNLDTRVSKVIKEKKYDAIVVARAGLLRLKKYLKYACPIPVEKILPAVGQAALGIEARKDDKRVLSIVKSLNDARTEREVLAERHFLNVLQGGCRVPVGIHSKIRKKRLYLKAAVFSVKSDAFIRAGLSGPVKNYKKTAGSLARRLLEKGAKKFLKEARQEGE